MNETISGTLFVGSGITPDIVLSDTSGVATIFNYNQQNIDFSILGTGVNGMIHYDASMGRLGIGTGLPDAVLHIVAPCAKDGLIVESITNCPTGVTLLLVHNPQTSPQSGSYPAIINLAGRDTNYEEIAYAQIMSRILDPVTGFTSGELIFNVDETGVSQPIFIGNLQNIVLGGKNEVSGYNYSIVGSNNSTSGVYLTSIGSSNSVVSDSGIVVGASNTINGSQILALVNNSELIGNQNISIGDSVMVYGATNTILGNGSEVSGSYNILLGASNDFITDYGVGLTQLSSSSGLSGIVLGSYTNNTGNYNIYIGNSNNLSGNINSIVGSYVSLTGSNTVVYGSSDNISGNSLIVIGSDQSVINVNSGIYIGNNITSKDSYRSIILGLGNDTRSGLQDSILIGINNNLSSGNPSSLLLVGQANTTKDIVGSLVVGNTNNLSGIVNNNLMVGSINAVPDSSNNNLVLGILNNQTGVYVDSAGSVSGTPYRVLGSVNNSIVAGINNLLHNTSYNDIIVGNKNTVSGYNDNVLGSFNQLQRSSNSYGVGNSNFLVGNKLGVFGNKTSVIGHESVVFNTANTKMDVFGSGNIVIGYNQAISSGIVIGTANKTHGTNNIVYGKNNTLGLITHQFTTDSLTPFSVDIFSLNVANKYTIGDTVLLCFQNPVSTNNVFVREISDIVEDTINTTTTITFSNTIILDSTNGYFNVNNAFDDNNEPNISISGLIMPYQQGGGLGGPETDPTYGSNNIVIGSNNNYIYSSGVVIGNNNTVSGVRNLVIGYGMSGVANNTLFIGTNNKNKVILDNDKVVFNSGAFQDNFIIKSSADTSSVVNMDLNNNYVGINTNTPTADLSVSGLTSTDSIRVGFTSSDRYVLTSDTNGYGTWQLPVRISGNNGGLMYRVSEKVGSGISEIIYNPATSSMNFNLDGNTGFIINSTGIYVNDDGNGYGLKIRGSGGADFAKTLLNTNFTTNSLDIFNINGNSGILNSITISSGINIPQNLTGTFLYANTGGKLLSSTLRPYSILFSNANSWATGNVSYRWIDTQSTLVMGSTGTVSYDELSTNTSDTKYNILLSSNNNIDTVFNNRGLGNKFAIINSGSMNNRRGLYVNPVSGQVAVNVIPDTYNNVTNQAHLYVEGKTWTQSLRVGAGNVSGLYLRVDSSGNVISSVLDLNTQFSGLYPLTATETSLGQDNAFRVDIGLSNKDRSGNSMGASGDGKFLIYDSAQWNISNGIKIPQSPWNIGQLRTLKGMEFGHKPKINYTYHTHAFSSSSFLETSSLYDGSSQFTQYYLRCRTTSAGAVELTTDFSKTSATSPGQYNTISLKNTNEYEYDNVWNYRILASVLWQDGSSSIDPASGSRSAAGMVIEGCIFRSADGSIFTKLGNENVKVYSTGNGVPGLPAGMGIGTYIDNDAQSSTPRLSVRATGVSGKTAVWTATAQINQLNHPGAYNLYGTT